MNSRSSPRTQTIEREVSKIYPDDWPEDYQWLDGYIYNGISNEFPRTFQPRPRGDIYLVPMSIACGASLRLLSKAQRSRICSHICPQIGSSVMALVRKKWSNVHDIVVKGIKYDMKDRNIEFAGGHFKVDCVVSPDNPPKCYSTHFDEFTLSPMFYKVTLIPNVVYIGYVDPKIIIINNNGKESGVNTELISKPELVNIVFVKPLEVYADFTEHFSILNACPWNLHRIKKLGKDEEFNDIALRPYITPKPPARKLKQVVLWYFSGNIVVRANVPKTVVKITEGLQRIGLPSELAEKLELRDGECLLATIVYSEFINCYYVEKYYMITNLTKQYRRVPKQRSLEKRNMLYGFEIVHEYSVRIHESTQFKSFFTCEPLCNCLIADPKNILRNVALEEHQEKGCPVWIRLEKDNDRLAHFSITELNRGSGEYSPKEKMMDYSNISGCGLLVCLTTGAVFSKDHLQKDIRLDLLGRYEVAMGHFFYFNAAYWPEKSYYIIGNFQPISAEYMEPIGTFYHENRLLFEDNFKCYCSQASETHYSQTFGPISDPYILITARARMKKIDWPKKADGYVGYNEDWKQGCTSKMMLFNELIDSEASDVTSEVMLIQKENNYKKCRCYDLWHLLHDIRTKTQGKKGVMKEELWQHLYKLEKKVQPLIEQMK